MESTFSKTYIYIYIYIISIIPILYFINKTKDYPSLYSVSQTPRMKWNEIGLFG